MTNSDIPAIRPDRSHLKVPADYPDPGSRLGRSLGTLAIFGWSLTGAGRAR